MFLALRSQSQSEKSASNLAGLENLFFVKNEAQLQGGAIYVSHFSKSTPTMHTVLFEENMAQFGAAFYINEKVSNLTFISSASLRNKYAGPSKRPAVLLLIHLLI